MKKLIALIFVICLSFIVFCNSPSVSAWIGTGTSGGGGSGGGSGSCGGETDKYGISCAGVSWAFYKAQGWTNNWTEFPYINSGLRVVGASIPPECSQHPDSGFWHFGINSFGAYIVDGDLWTTTAEWAHEYGSPWWGHWLTMNPGNSATSWAPYKTSGLGARQWVGPYQMDHYGSWNEALQAYQEAYLFDHPGAAKPTSIPGDVWGFCYWPGMKEVTLTVKSIDTNGNSLSHKMADKTNKGSPGTEHSVTIGNIPGYTKIYWGTSTNSSTWWDNTDMTYKENITTNKTIYAVYVKNQYQGLSQVSQTNADWNIIPNDQKKSTGYTQSNKTVTQYINNCDPANGCTAKFWHYLKRTAGLGSTTFNITRSSNYYTIGSGTVISSRTETFSSGNEVNEHTEAFVNKLYPGQMVCETLSFDVDIDTKNIKTTACAVALGNAQPTGADNSLGIKVKNQSTTNTYQKEVYAKPGDTLVYQPLYKPTLQYAYRLIPQQYRIDGGAIRTNTNGSNLYTLFNSANNCKSSNANCWKNSFSVERSKLNNNFNSGASLISNYSYNIGQTTANPPTNNYIVLPNDVGSSIDERAITNLNSTTKTTPSQITFTNNSGRVLANIITSPLSDIAYARTPYNFTNTTNITFNDTNNPLYAGENKEITFNINTNTRYNSVTRGTYATIVKNAKWKLQLCYNDNCQWTSEKTGNLNASNSYTGKTEQKNLTISIPDVPAGTQVCLTSAVYPADSGANTNWQDSEGSHTWAYSAPSCFIVAKKPSLQIWGGNTYTSGNIDTTTATKNNLAGYHPYGIETKHGDFVFGSWTELGLIANGSVTGFSSGASLGYATNSSGNLSPNPYNTIDNNNPLAPNPGGNNQVSLCNRSPLTFANCANNSDSVGEIGNTTSANSINDEKSSIITKFMSEENTSSDNLTISGTVINRGTIQIIHSTKDINITDNLTYENSYTNFNDMPKLIIYAKGNINIACNVTHIDALLIADHAVNTCADSSGNIPDINSQDRSNQLIINGAIISGSLQPTRTYGAATGANSIVPAEIINYDPSLYLWGGEQSQTAASVNTNLNTSYQKELAPRR